MKQIARLLLAFTTTAAAAAGASAEAAPANVREAIDRAVTPLIEKGKNVGISVGVISIGERTFAGYGRIDSAREGVPTAETVYEIGSISKVFTSVLLAAMEKEGAVKLDDPLAKFVPPDVTVPTRDDKAITLLDIATQTSGLPRLPPGFKTSNESDPYADYTPEKLYGALNKTRLVSKPGEKYLYSNFAVALLGQALADVAKTDYETALRKRVLDPLAMNSTSMTLTPEIQSRLAPPFLAPGKPGTNWNLAAFAGAGGLRSSTTDMMKFLAAAMEAQNGKSPLADLFKETETPLRDVAKGTRIGMGWHITDNPKLGDQVIWHNGATGGYCSFLGFAPKRGLGVVILTNTASEVDSPAIGILESLGELTAPKVP